MTALAAGGTPGDDRDHQPGHVLEAAARLLPTSSLDGGHIVRGQFHDVLLLPGLAVVRVARDARSAGEMPRRTTLLHRLHHLHVEGRLPLVVPRPLTEVLAVAGPTGPTAAVAHTWVDGRAHPRGNGDPAALRALLAGLAAAPTDGLADVLGAPRGYAGAQRWPDLAEAEVLPRIPPRWRAAAAGRVAAVAEMPSAAPALVHGDLAGHNLLWGTASLPAVLDWDFASAWDPAVDVACLAGWHGWTAVSAAVADHDVVARARTWAAVFPLEQVASAVHHGEPEDVVERFVERAVADLARGAP